MKIHQIQETTKIDDRTKLNLHENTCIGDFTFISCNELHMDEGACINRFCELQGRGDVYIGKYAQVASYVSLMTTAATPMGHMSDMIQDESKKRTRTEDIVIEDYAYIERHSVIMPGVTIGEGAVVGAYSYIAQNIPAWTVSHPPKGKPHISRRRIDDGVGIKPFSGVGFKAYNRDITTNNNEEEP